METNNTQTNNNEMRNTMTTVTEQKEIRKNFTPKINVRMSNYIAIIDDIHGQEVGAGDSIQSAYEAAIANCPKDWTAGRVEKFINNCRAELKHMTRGCRLLTDHR